MKKNEQNLSWSEEDEMIALSIEQVMNCASLLNIVPEKIDRIRTWLKSIKDRVGCEIDFTTKKEWSEDDERNLQGIIDEIEANKHSASYYDLATYDRFLSWLKSLKYRYTWKPSDEQIVALEHFVRSIWESEFASPYNNNIKLVYLLLNQLKKLKD